MNSSPADADLVVAAERSADAVGRHDRSGWIALFTSDARVEDPVGSRPHVGHGQIGRFYDTFIAPREVVFDRDADFVSDRTVVRDLTLRVAMGPGVAMAIPAILRYAIRDSDSELKIAHLQAYWELPSMMRQFAGKGLPAVPVGLGLARALVANQGIGGSLGFLAGFRRPGRRAHTVLHDLLTALSVGDELAVRRVISQGATLNIGADELAARLRGVSWEKILAAGRSLTASVHGAGGRGVVIADFAEGAVLRRLQLFTE